MRRFDGPIYLDKPSFTFTELAFLGELPEPLIRRWYARGMLIPQRHLYGRLLLTPLDALRLAVMRDLTEVVPLGPTVASQAAEAICRYVRETSPRTDEGAFLDLQAINPAMVFSFAYRSGEMGVDLLDMRPGWTLPAARVIVSPAELLARVSYRLLQLAAAATSPQGAGQ